MTEDLTVSGLRFEQLDASALATAFGGFGFSVEDVDAGAVGEVMRGAATSITDYWPDAP